MEEARAVLGYRWDAIETWIMSQRNALHRDISASFGVLSDTLQGMLYPDQVIYLRTTLTYYTLKNTSKLPLRRLETFSLF